MRKDEAKNAEIRKQKGRKEKDKHLQIMAINRSRIHQEKAKRKGKDLKANEVAENTFSFEHHSKKITNKNEKDHKGKVKDKLKKKF